MRGFTIQGFSDVVDAPKTDAAILFVCADDWRVWENDVSDGKERHRRLGVRQGLLSHDTMSGFFDSGAKVVSATKARIETNTVTNSEVAFSSRARRSRGSITTR